MSFETAARGRAGSATPPDPCAHSGAATSEATAAVAHHRAQCVIPTSVESRRLLPSTERESQVHVATGSRLIIPPRHEPATHPDGRGVDRDRPHVLAVEDVVQAHKRLKPHAAKRPVPPQAYARRPPRARPRGERVVDKEAGGMRFLDLRPRPARPRGPRLKDEVEPVFGDTRDGAIVQVV